MPGTHVVAVWDEFNEKFLEAKPYVYHNGEWYATDPYVYSSNNWQTIGGAHTLMVPFLTIDNEYIYTSNNEVFLVRNHEINEGQYYLLPYKINGEYVYAANNQLVVVPNITITQFDKKNCIIFTSSTSFTLSTRVAGKYWDGILEYSINEVSWTEWDGTTTITSGLIDGVYKIYMRGNNNTYISPRDLTQTSFNSFSFSYNSSWKLTGSNITISGNLGALLDWLRIKNGLFPEMEKQAFYALFGYNSSSIINVSGLILPNKIATDYCYCEMFAYCSALITAPHIWLETTALGCCQEMFAYCASLILLIKLKPLELINQCYCSMFENCSNIKISSSQTGIYVNTWRCPHNGTGINVNNSALDFIFSSTGGTFTTTPSINTTYYTSNEIIG